jgi:hypothetical protein
VIEKKAEMKKGKGENKEMSKSRQTERKEEGDSDLKKTKMEIPVLN